TLFRSKTAALLGSPSRIGFLYMAKTANQRRHGGERNGSIRPLGRQRPLDQIQIGLVAGQKLPLHAPLGGIAEGIEGRAAQPPEAGKNRERLHHPRAVTRLLQAPSS